MKLLLSELLFNIKIATFELKLFFVGIRYYHSINFIKIIIIVVIRI